MEHDGKEESKRQGKQWEKNVKQNLRIIQNASLSKSKYMATNFKT